MITYHVLYNPHAGNGRGKEAAYRLATLLPDDKILFQDITEVDDYGGFFDSLPHDDRVVIAGGDGTLNRFIGILHRLFSSAQPSHQFLRNPASSRYSGWSFRYGSRSPQMV